MSELTNKRSRNSALHANHRKRMKDKFLNFGLQPFLEHEIMEMLLYYALPQVDTNEIAHNLINKGGSFVGALNLSYDEMKSVPGIKDHAATFLKLIPEIVRYYSVQEAEQLSTPGMTYDEIAKLCVKYFIGAKNEVLVALFFDSKMKFLGSDIIGEGNYNRIITDNKSFSQKIVSHQNAVYAVVAHNHPSTSIVPSADDVDSTKHIREIFSNAGIELIENFIISGDTYQGVIKFHEQIRTKYKQELSEKLEEINNNRPKTRK